MAPFWPLVYVFLIFVGRSAAQLADIHHEYSPAPLASSDSSDSSESDASFATPIPHMMVHNHGVPILQTELRPLERAFWEAYNTTTFFSAETPRKLALYLHVILIALSAVFIYPVCLVLNNVRSRFYVPALTVHLLALVVAILNYFVFMLSAPNLYPGNAYTPMSWVLLFATCSHWGIAVLRAGFDYLHNEGPGGYAQLDENCRDLDEVLRCTSPSSTLYDLPTFDHDGENEYKTYSSPTTSLYVAKVLGKVWARKTVHFFGAWAIVLFNLLNWGLFLYYLVYIPTAIAVLGCFGQGKSVFNLLAHFIKGGVFFSLGLLYLSRYCGAFSGKGWAWNHKFVLENEIRANRWARIQSSGLFTMEMVESSLILFYGCTNIFLEHLSNAGGEWSAKDLQHASIAFIYIGCGLCGVITESKLSTWRYERAMSASPLESTSRIIKASPGFSPNPFPVLTIFWTGVLMSKHQQASLLSTEIHTQWGNLFVLGCAFRFLTYILMLILPADKNSTRPPRLITELIVSFALLCGGAIFMESCDPVILAMEYRGYTSMFALNINLGIVALLMAWLMGLFAIKDRLLLRKVDSLA